MIGETLYFFLVSLPLLLVFSVKRGHRAAILGKLFFLLYGVKSVNYDINCALFCEVQSFIINTNRFSIATV